MVLEGVKVEFRARSDNTSSDTSCWQDFEWVTLAMMPMFLFSTTFFPLGVYPRGLQIFVECMPLYQGIEIVRGLMLGAVEPALIGRAAYLALVGIVGLSIVSRRLGKLLLS
jgi:lipooligosaccharide transport system permease protein